MVGRLAYIAHVPDCCTIVYTEVFVYVHVCVNVYVSVYVYVYVQVYVYVRVHVGRRGIQDVMQICVTVSKPAF